MAPPESSGGDHLLESGLLSAAEKQEAGTTSTSPSMPGARRKSETSLLARRRGLRRAVAQVREVFLGTKLCPLFFAVPVAVAAEYLHLGRAWVFAFSLIGLAPLAERVSFLSEHIANTTGPTAGGLLNATCGNVPELIIALLALHTNKMEILKWSLLGSILSNLLLVLGSSIFCGGIANIGKERPSDKRQADVSISLLLLGVLCHIATTMSKYTISTGYSTGSSSSILVLSRTSAIIMLVAYFGSLLFHLKTHRQDFEQEEESSESSSEDDTLDISVIGFASAVVWLTGMAAVIALLSYYVVTTIEEASKSLGIPVRFISVILLPIVGNAAEHAGAIIFAFKNKIDITLGITLGSSTQISMLVVPIIVLVSWMNGIPMDLDFNILETGSLAMAVIITAFTLQDNSWHYLKGFNLILCYVVIAVCFFTVKEIPTQKQQDS